MDVLVKILRRPSWRGAVIDIPFNLCYARPFRRARPRAGPDFFNDH